MENVVRRIHESHLKGIISENGAGPTVQYLLSCVEGCSNTVIEGKFPYGRETSEKLYSDLTPYWGKGVRAVSREVVYGMVKTEKQHETANFVYASSWQIKAHDQGITHGWIAIWDKRTDNIYQMHFTFHEHSPVEREIKVAEIGRLGVELIAGIVEGDTIDLSKVFSLAPPSLAIPNYFSLDEMYTGKAEETYLGTKIDIDNLFSCIMNSFVVIGPDQTGRLKYITHRFEEILRKNENIILYRGSFNPLHHGHVEIMKHASTAVGNNPVECYCISLKNYDKPAPDYTEVFQRACSIIDKTNAYVIISYSSLFYEMFDLLNQLAPKNKFFFPLGMDTMNRICESDSKYPPSILFRKLDQYDNMKVLLFNREKHDRHERLKLYADIVIEVDSYKDDGISSTDVRQKTVENKL